MEAFDKDYTLNDYYYLVKRTILDFQHPVTGLFPASLYQAKFDKKACGDSWIRDNVYSILAVWGLSKIYKNATDFTAERFKQYELEQSVVKLMRGLLTSMMQQLDKVENFKKTQSEGDSLHAKYSYSTGKTVVGDNEWGHLQIDAISLYLLILAQMITSGLQIIFTKDEVDFVQNLVFYIECAYRVPDFGIWERGDKTNRGLPELNSSSIGMAKAALEAMNELDVFGSRGGPGSVIHVQADHIQYCKAVLHSMLPRESYSKECSASLLSVISYPAFAVEDGSLIEATKSEIVGRLEGVYGCKRFLRDGHHCQNEDRYRLHYELHELKKFEHIECQWPMFFCFLVLDGIYNDNMAQVKKYSDLLEQVLIPTEDGVQLLPELFYVPKDKIEAEQANPHSQARLCGNQVPHLWTQSLFIVGRLLQKGLVAVGELDPLNRRYVATSKPGIVVQVALIAEDEQIKELLAGKGIVSQLAEEAYPIRILSAKCLSWIYSRLGINDKLGLSGRPNSSIGTIGICSIYRCAGKILAFTPRFLDYRQFYLCLDNDLLVDSFKTEIEYLRYNWRQLGRPTITIPITHSLLEDSFSSTTGKFLLQITSGYLYSVRIRVGKLSDLLSRSSVKNLDFIDPVVLEERLSTFPDPTQSPRPAEVSRHTTTRERTNSDGSERHLNIAGCVIKSRVLSRAASWGASSDSEDENSNADLVRGFVMDVIGSDDDVSDYVNDIQEDVDIDDVREDLENTDDIMEQAVILHFLYKTRGVKFDVKLNGVEGNTVENLLENLYEKACHLKLWSLIRHSSGMLYKQVESLGPNCTELLVNQKKIGVGLPHLQREEIISQPLPPKELRNLIYRACDKDSSTAVLTQELLTYLAMFVKSEPGLFEEMLQIRIGLIMEVMAAEYARTSGLSGEDAAEHLMNLTPFQMKTLLYYILTGKEFGVKQVSNKSIVVETPISTSSESLTCFRTTVKRISKILQVGKDHTPEACDFQTSISDSGRKIGQWLRRRCLDGALNRVPRRFYVKVWHVLVQCQGLAVSEYEFMLEHRLTLENTSGEMKFALKVEEELNKIIYPEYRQLVVEVMIVLSTILERRHLQSKLDDVIRLDQIVRRANELFLENQRCKNGDATLCCAKLSSVETKEAPCKASHNICRYFYDSAPSGTYGTMTYFAKAVLQFLYKDYIQSNEIFRIT